MGNDNKTPIVETEWNEPTVETEWKDPTTQKKSPATTSDASTKPVSQDTPPTDYQWSSQKTETPLSTGVEGISPQVDAVKKEKDAKVQQIKVADATQSLQSFLKSQAGKLDYMSEEDADKLKEQTQKLYKNIDPNIFDDAYNSALENVKTNYKKKERNDLYDMGVQDHAVKEAMVNPELKDMSIHDQEDNYNNHVISKVAQTLTPQENEIYSLVKKQEALPNLNLPKAEFIKQRKELADKIAELRDTPDLYSTATGELLGKDKMSEEQRAVAQKVDDRAQELLHTYKGDLGLALVKTQTALENAEHQFASSQMTDAGSLKGYNMLTAEGRAEHSRQEAMKKEKDDLLLERDALKKAYLLNKTSDVRSSDGFWKTMVTNAVDNMPVVGNALKEKSTHDYAKRIWDASKTYDLPTTKGQEESTNQSTLETLGAGTGQLVNALPKLILAGAITDGVGEISGLAKLVKPLISADATFLEKGVGHTIKSMEEAAKFKMAFGDGTGGAGFYAGQQAVSGLKLPFVPKSLLGVGVKAIADWAMQAGLGGGAVGMSSATAANAIMQGLTTDKSFEKAFDDHFGNTADKKVKTVMQNLLMGLTLGATSIGEHWETTRKNAIEAEQKLRDNGMTKDADMVKQTVSKFEEKLGAPLTEEEQKLHKELKERKSESDKNKEAQGLSKEEKKQLDDFDARVADHKEKQKAIEEEKKAEKEAKEKQDEIDKKLEANKKVSELVPGVGGEKEVEAEIKGEDGKKQYSVGDVVDLSPKVGEEKVEPVKEKETVTEDKTETTEEPKIEPVKVAGTEVVEHGEDTNTAKGLDNGIKPTTLTDKGIAYAKELGKHVKNLGKKLIVTSDVARAKETGKIASEASGIATEVNKNLNTWNIGEHDGGKVGAFDEKYYTEHPDEAPKGGESFNDFKARMELAHKEVKDMSKDVQVVAHSKVQRAFEALDKTDGKWTDETTKEFSKAKAIEAPQVETKAESGKEETLSSIVDSHDNSETATIDDLINNAEAQASQSENQTILDAVEEYRREQEEDRKLSGRGDLESAQNKVERIIRAEAKKENQPKSKKEKAEKKEVVVIGDLTKLTNQELLQRNLDSTDKDEWNAIKKELKRREDNGTWKPGGQGTPAKVEAAPKTEKQKGKEVEIHNELVDNLRGFNNSTKKERTSEQGRIQKQKLSDRAEKLGYRAVEGKDGKLVIIDGKQKIGYRGDAIKKESLEDKATKEDYRKARQRALNAEPMSLRQAIMQYFVGGGKMHDKAFETFSGAGKGEKESARWGLSSDASKSINEDLTTTPEVFEQWSKETKSGGAKEVASEVASVLGEFGSRTEMEKALVESHEDFEFKNEHDGMSRAQYEREIERAQAEEDIANEMHIPLDMLQEGFDEIDGRPITQEEVEKEYNDYQEYLKNKENEAQPTGERANGENNAQNQIRQETATREQRQAELTAKQRELASAESEYDKLNKGLNKDLKNKQLGIALEDADKKGKQMNLLDDNADLSKRVEEARIKKEGLQEEVGRLQKLVDEDMKGQQKMELKPKLKGKDLIADGLDDLMNIIGGKVELTGEERPKVITALTKIGRGLIDEGIATAENVVEKIREYVKGKIKDADFEDVKDDVGKLFAKEEKPSGEVGISAKAREKRAEQTGVDPADAGVGWTGKDALERGRELLSHGIDPNEAIRDNAIPLHDRVAIAQAHLSELAKETNRQADIDKESQAYKDALQKENDFAKETKKLSTESHLAFAAHQGGVDIDTGSWTGLERAFREEHGVEPTEAQKKQAEQLANEVKSRDAKISELEKKLYDLHDKKSAETTKTYASKAKDIADQFRKLKTKPITFKDANGNDIHITQMSVVDWNGLVELGANTIEKTGELADGVKAIIDELKGHEWYAKLSDRDKDAVNTQIEDLITESKKSDNEKATERAIKAKELAIKNAKEKLSGKEKVKSKSEVDLENEKLKTLTKEHKDLKDKLSELSKQRRADELMSEKEKILSKLVDKEGNNFSNEEVKAIWDHAKENYIDKGITDFDKMTSSVADDLGLSQNQVKDAISKPKGAREITDEMYRVQSRRREAINNAKIWVKSANDPILSKALKMLPSFWFRKAVFGHGTVGMITHAGPNIFRPSGWKEYFPNFIRQFQFMSRIQHERFMQNFEKQPDFTFWKRAGLSIDPHKSYDEYTNQTLKKASEIPVIKQIKGLWDASNKMGNRGFDALKVYRYDQAKTIWDGLKDYEKTPEMAKSVSDMVNASTGTVSTNFGPIVSSAFFAPRLEASRWKRLIGTPFKTAMTVSKVMEGKATTEEKVAAKLVAKRTGESLATISAMLAANAAILYLTNSKDKINFTHPTESDFLRFKAKGKKIDVSGGMLPTASLISTLVNTAFAGSRKVRGKEKPRDEQIYKKMGQQVRGKLSPGFGTLADFITQRDFMGNVMPFSSDKPMPYERKLTWGDYIKETQLPIPISAYFKSIQEGMKDGGMKADDIKNVFGSVLTGIIMGTTGAHIGNPPYDSGVIDVEPKSGDSFKSISESWDKKERYRIGNAIYVYHTDPNGNEKWMPEKVAEQIDKQNK